MRKQLAIGVAGLALALSSGLVACGSGDEAGDSSPPETQVTGPTQATGPTPPAEQTPAKEPTQPTGPLEKSELIARADAICARDKQRLTELSSKLQNPDYGGVVAFIANDVVPLYERQIKKLRKLTPEPADADAFNDYLDTFQAELKAVAADPEANKDSPNPFPKASQAAQNFGLTQCGF